MVPKSSYYFVNTDEHLDYIQPITQKIVHIGGLRLGEPKPLPEVRILKQRFHLFLNLGIRANCQTVGTRHCSHIFWNGCFKLTNAQSDQVRVCDFHL